LRNADHVITITNEEQVFIHKLAGPISSTVIPPMIDLCEFMPKSEGEEEGTILFFGSFAHYPNIDAIRWFCNNVFPTIVADYPGAHLTIAGAYANSRVGDLKTPKIDIIDYIEDIKPLIAKTAVIISPIQSGGGTRIKNIEALAAGKALVTTSLGAEGLVGPTGRGYRVADDPDRFASEVIDLLSNPLTRKLVGNEGRQMIEQGHDIRRVIERLERVFLLEAMPRNIKI
jgi:glycosyltransferase involved in cell wall biosynthesis